MYPDETDPPEAAGWEDARDEERSVEGGYTTGPDRSVLEAARQQSAGLSRGPRAYRRSDERIREDVYERLFGNTGADASEVTVQVSSGVVTLTGSVPYEEDKRRIARIAGAALCVREVVDRIVVATQPAATAEAQPATRELEPAED